MASVTIAYISAAISVASTVYQILNTPDQQKIGVKTQKRGTDAPRKVAYGNAIVDSTNVYNNVLNSNSSWLTKVFSLGVGTITQIEQVYVDDFALLKVNNTNDFSLQPTAFFTVYPNGSGPFVTAFEHQAIKMQFRYGLTTETASNLAITYGDGEWTQAHRGDRVPQVILAVNRSTNTDTRIISSRYTLTAKVIGVPVYDPRFNNLGEKSYYPFGQAQPSLYTSGRNPPICLLDFLTDTYYGMAIDYSYINEQSFIDCANWTDANFIYIDGAVDTGQTFGDCISQIMSTFQGILVIENGLITCKYEDIVLTPYPTTFNEDNTLSIGGIKDASSSQYYNIVETNYKNIILKEKGDVFQIPQDINFIPVGQTKSRISIDGFKKTKKLDMPMTIDNYNNTVTGAVKLFSNRLYIQALYQKSVDISVDLKQYPVSVFDVIKISNKNLNWIDKLFRIRTINKSVNNDSFNVGSLTCTEYNDAVYQGTLDGLTGRNRLRNTELLLPVTNLAFNLDNFIHDGYGTLSWTNPNVLNILDFVVEYKLSTETVYKVYTTVNTTESKIIGLKQGNYDFRLQAKRIRWFSSPYTEILNQSVAPLSIFPDVTNVLAESSGLNFNFSWDDMLDLNILNVIDPTDPNSNGTSGKVKDYFKYYKVDVYNGTVLKDTFKVNDNKFSYLYEDNVASTLSRTVNIKVFIVGKDDNISANGGIVSVTNPQVSAPTNITINVLLGLANISWEPKTDNDFSGTEIHISTVSNFTPSSANLVDTLQSESTYQYTFPIGDITDRYIAIGHFDKFSKTGINYSIPQLIHTTAGFSISNAETLRITASSQIFSYDANGILKSSNLISFIASRQNITATTQWTTTPNVATGSGDSFSLSDVQFSNNQNVKVTATAGIYTDEITVVRLQDGSNGSNGSNGLDGLTAILSNESHTIPTDPSGNNGNYLGSATTIKLYEGANELIYDAVGTNPATWKIVSTGTNITSGSITDAGNYVSIGNASYMTADTAQIQFVITGKRLTGQAISITKIQTFSKSKTGSNGSNGARGSKHFYKDITPLSNLSALDFDTQANLAITEAGEIKVNRDVVTLTNPTSAYSETKYWNSIPATPLWDVVSEVIDGNLIVNGTVGANKINVTDLFAQTITATGSITGATLQTAPTNTVGYRTVMSTANPFQVQKDNKFVFGLDPNNGFKLSGELAAGTISNTNVFSSDILDLLMNVNTIGATVGATGGTASVYNVALNGNAAVSSTLTINANSTPVIISINVTDIDYTAIASVTSKWDITLTRDAVNTVPALLITTVTGGIIYEPNTTPYIYLDQTVTFTDNSPTTGVYVVTVTRNSGSYGSPLLKSFTISQAVNTPTATTYTLPPATTSVLGGVKVGANLTVDINGVLSANAQTSGGASYTGHRMSIGTGNTYTTGGFETRGNGTTNTIFPTVGFHQPGLYAGSIQLRAGGDFWFVAQGGTSPNATVRAANFVGNLNGFNTNSNSSINTVVVRNSSGYILGNFFNGTGTFGTSGNPSGMAIFTGTNGTDTYGRSYTAAAARQLLNVANGANNVTLLSQLTNDVGFITSSNVYYAGAGLTLTGTTFTPTFGIGTTSVARGDHNHNGVYLPVNGTAVLANAVTTYNSTSNTYYPIPLLSSNKLFTGTGSPSLNPVSGNISTIGTVFTYDTSASSDIRLKRNIKEIQNASQIRQAITGNFFDKKRSLISKVYNKTAGLIADTVEKVFPIAILQDKDGIKSLSISSLLGLLFQSANEDRSYFEDKLNNQQKQINELKELLRKDNGSS